MLSYSRAAFFLTIYIYNTLHAPVYITTCTRISSGMVNIHKLIALLYTFKQLPRKKYNIHQRHRDSMEMYVCMSILFVQVSADNSD